MKLALLAILLIAPLVATNDGGSDRVTLASGEVLTGRVVLEDAARLVIVPRRGGKERVVPLVDVRDAITVERTLRKMFERLDALATDDVEGLLDTADFAAVRGVDSLARILRLRALLHDPTSKRAYEALDGAERSRGWQIRIDKTWYTIEELRSARKRWRDAMEHPTPHFVLRTDLPLEQALDLALDLERTYLAFYDLMRPTLPLRVFEERPEVRVYLEEGSYLEPSYGASSWFDWDANIVYVRAEEGATRRPLVYEATRALLRNAFYATKGAGGQVQMWADLGIAEVFAAAAQGEPGKTKLDLGTLSRQLYALHAQSNAEVGIDRVLVAAQAEFYVGTIAPRLRSRSYTLTDFLLFAEDATHREKFLRYVMSSFESQGSPTHFEKIFETDVEKIEAAWKKHVEEVASKL